MLDDLNPAQFEDTARAVIAGCARATDPAQRAILLSEAGLLGVCAPEEVGGLALPLQFAAPLATAAGAQLLAFPLIETLLLTRHLATAAPNVAADLCAGRTLATIAWTGTAEDAVVGGAPLGAAAALVLVFRPDGTAALVSDIVLADGPVFDLETPEATLRPGAGLPVAALDADTVAALCAEAQILRTAFIAGSAGQCLQMAASYAQERVQFGKPLAANQALRHRLSRDALALETLRNGLTRALAEPAEGAAMARRAAWLGAAQMGPAIAESAIQVMGGMGFTWEVPLHRYLRQMRMQAVHGGALADLADLAGTIVQRPGNHWYEDLVDAV